MSDVHEEFPKQRKSTSVVSAPVSVVVSILSSCFNALVQNQVIGILFSSLKVTYLRNEMSVYVLSTCGESSRADDIESRC